MKLRLNLSTKPHQNNRPFVAAAALVGVLGLLAFLILARSAYVSWQSNRELRADIARLQEEISVDQRSQLELQTYFRSPQAQQVLDRASFLNSLIGERSFPWTSIFMDLERSLPPGVRVVSISPRLINGRAEVSLKVGAETDESKIQFLEVMEKSKVFSGMVVKQEQHSDQPGAPDRIVLDLTVWYTST
jgi:Tfp pilus assembly protein PilN